MTPLSDTLAAVMEAINAMPESLKTRQIMTDRLAALSREVEKDLAEPRTDRLTAILTLTWVAAVQAENAAHCEFIAEQWMTQRRATAPLQVVRFYCGMLEHGWQPVFQAPPVANMDEVPANFSPQIRRAVDKISESLPFLPKAHKKPVITALMRHLTNVEIHLTATQGVKAVKMYESVTKLATWDNSPTA